MHGVHPQCPTNQHRTSNPGGRSRPLRIANVPDYSPAITLNGSFTPFSNPPMETDPARRVCSTPGPGGRGQAMTVPAWCHLRGSKAGEEPPCTRCMEDIPTCLPKASEWDKEPVRATGCLLGGQGAACRLWYQAGGARGGWPECRPHLQ